MDKRCLGCMEEYSGEFEVCPHCGYVEGTEVEEAVHMEPGASLADRYTIGKVLGYGGFGVTYIAWDKLLEQKVAIKEYLPSEFSTRMPGDPTVTVFSGDRNEQFHEGLDKFVEEAKRLSKFQNEAGIVKVFDSFKANNTAYIVMEYLDGETLTSYMEREGLIPEDKAVEMLAPVMISLQAVHEEGILHRDIAPDNIFLTKNGEVKLIDFGASRYATTSHSRSLTVIIKPGYSPEEQYRSRGDQGPHTDVYALAAVMYKMITGITPPDALERRALIETKKKELLKDIHKTNKTISPNIENAILNAMNVQVEDRTADIVSFMSELNSTAPVKRRYGKIKKIDVYAWPLWIKIVIPAVVVAFLTTAILLITGVIDFPSLFSGNVEVPEGMVIVPDVEGETSEVALKELNEINLTPSPEGNIESEYIEAGQIVLQTPMGGSYLEKYGKVVLTVSSGKGVVAAVDGTSTVPYVIWDTKDVAIAKLMQAGLAEPIIETEYDDNVPEGQVISQSVSVGTKVEEGTQIAIVVSKGAKPFAMPKVIGKTKQSAESELSAKGLAVYFEYVKDDSVAENTVLEQDVSEGTMVKKGTKVTLKISSKSETVVVANVVGKTKSDANATLKNQGFGVRVLENYDESVPKGNVISQAPAAGTSHIVGSPITIVVSKGVPNVTVPNVVGKTEVSAKSDLTNQRLGVKVEYQANDTVESGQVISQAPAANTSHPQGTTVTIYVSTGKVIAQVPSVVGQTESSASTILSINKFSVKVEYQTHDTVEAGKVISQTPAAKTSHPQGTIITIYVSTGKPLVTVPDVVGKTETNAVSTLQNAGLTVTTSEEYNSSVEKGKVISQSIKSGEKVTTGTQINLVISLGERTTAESYFSTSVSNGEAKITDFPESYEGDVVIPKTIGGYPVTMIGMRAFEKCALLTSITIPDGVTSIEWYAFKGCSNLASITIPDSVTTIKWYAFEDCSNLTNITIPDSVTVIGGDAFLNTGYYKNSQNWENGVLYIGNHLVAAQNDSVSNVAIKTGTLIIAENGFNDCTNLKSVTIPYSVTHIGLQAFSDCTSLTNVTISNGVTNIGYHAFSGCSNLTSITFPASVTNIGQAVFLDCSNLVSINIDSENNCYSSQNGVLFDKAKTKLIKFPECNTATSYAIPDSVTSIEIHAFYNCTRLESITIPNSVTSIGEGAFWYCKKLTSVTIPASVTNIGQAVFLGCSNLVSINVDSENNCYSSQNGILFDKAKTKLIKSPKCNTVTSYTVPDSVTSIEENAFYNCTRLKSITIPDSVTSIGSNAFYLCTRLETVYFSSQEQKDKFANSFDSNVELIVL